MIKVLAYLTAVAFVFALVASSGGIEAHDAAANGGTDSALYVWCDYEGPDAVITPYGTMPASYTHFVDDGSTIESAPEGEYIYGPDSNLTELVPTEEQLPDWVHFVEITKP